MAGGSIDLGGGHTIRFTTWKPDRDLNPQYAGLPDVERIGYICTHPDVRDPARTCTGSGMFTGDVADQSWEPLSLSPSLLCTVCGDHGLIREGRWVPA